MPKIIDTNRECTRALPALRAAGVETIIRYYARAMSPKVIRRPEALAIGRAGLRLAIVYEGAGNSVSAFSQEIGARDAAFSRTHGAKDIDQPAGSAVYFAVDFDADDAQIENAVIPYFQGVAGAFAERNGLPVYRIGVYGSGAVCRAVLDAGLAELAWLSCSNGWRGYRDFLASGRWNLRQHTPRKVAGIDADPNDVNPKNSDIGDFVPGTAPSASPPPAPVGYPSARGPGRFAAMLKRLRKLLGW